VLAHFAAAAGHVSRRWPFLHTRIGDMAFGAGDIQRRPARCPTCLRPTRCAPRRRATRIEAQEYGLAAQLARERAVHQDIDRDQGGAGEPQHSQDHGPTAGRCGGVRLFESGSALDLLRDSASQGALTKATLQQQGIIDQDSYEAQAKSYDLMQQSALVAATAADKAAHWRDITGHQGRRRRSVAILGGMNATDQTI
jgi:hypothetical protein